MKMFKKFAAICLAAAMACVSATAYADEVIETTAQPQTLEVYCPGANDDPEFPFNFDIDVDPSSISYIDLDEPIYGFERLLDREALDFDVKFTLKDEYKDFDSYEFQVLDADYTEEIAAGVFENDEVFTIPGLEIGMGYNIRMTLKSEQMTAYYVGQFVTQAEFDSTLATDLFYQLADVKGEAALYVINDTENDSRNNNPNTPDEIKIDHAMVGTVPMGDVDYYYIHIPKQAKGIANLSLTVNPPSDGSIIIEFVNDVNKTKSIVTHSGGSYLSRFPNLATGMDYKIKVTRSYGSDGKYTITPKVDYGLAWFGQYISNDYVQEYWNADKLDDLKHLNESIFVEGSKNRDESWFAESCGIVGSAMILKNKGLTMNGYDFRTDYYGDLQADPFTVMLANCNKNGNGMNPQSVSLPGYSGTPSILVSGNVAEKFGCSWRFVSETSVSVSNLGGTPYEETLRNEIRNNGYVLIYFNKKEAPMHFMVLTDIETGNGTFAERATVYDPAAMSYAAGAGVKLSQTDWFKRNKNIAKLSTSRVYF